MKKTVDLSELGTFFVKHSSLFVTHAERDEKRIYLAVTEKDLFDTVVRGVNSFTCANLTAYEKLSLRRESCFKVAPGSYEVELTVFAKERYNAFCGVLRGNIYMQDLTVGLVSCELKNDSFLIIYASLGSDHRLV